MEMMRIEHGLIENDIPGDQILGAELLERTTEKNKCKHLGSVPKIILLMP